MREEERCKIKVYAQPKGCWEDNDPRLDTRKEDYAAVCRSWRSVPIHGVISAKVVLKGIN